MFRCARVLIVVSVWTDPNLDLLLESPTLQPMQYLGGTTKREYWEQEIRCYYSYIFGFVCTHLSDISAINK